MIEKPVDVRTFLNSFLLIRGYLPGLPDRPGKALDTKLGRTKKRRQKKEKSQKEKKREERERNINRKT